MRRAGSEVDDTEVKWRKVPSSSSTRSEKMIDLKSDILSLTSVVTVEVEDADLTEAATPMSLATSMMLGGGGGVVRRILFSFAAMISSIFPAMRRYSNDRCARWRKIGVTGRRGSWRIKPREEDSSDVSRGKEAIRCGPLPYPSLPRDWVMTSE